MDESPETTDPAPVDLQAPVPLDAPVVVGIGASAGGLEALERLFEGMPVDSGLSFVVIQHLSPDYRSLMDELLAKWTTMKIHRVVSGMSVEPNSIYLIPPKNNMIIFHNQLVLMEQDADRYHGINLPIDIFFRSLAEDLGDRAIGIVLSGTGSDGTRGLRAIKEAGGIILVQDENSAKFDGMPRSAVATGLVDFVMRPEEMGTQLLALRQRPRVANLREDDALLMSEETLVKIAAMLRKRTGLDVTHYKPTTVVRRIERRMGLNQIGRLADYVQYLEQEPKELDLLYKDVLIGVTGFFRDRPAFDLIRSTIVPALLQARLTERKIRVWVAGCSTGEEVYSLAICFAEAARELGQDFDIKIFGTDIDRDAIETAGQGVFPAGVVGDVEPDLLSRYFLPRGHAFQVRRDLREMVVFAQQNLLRDPPFTRIDLVSCRNLLIYLLTPMQRRILSLFSFSLRPDGVLFLGSSESIGELTEQFEVVDSRWKIFRSRGTARLPLNETISLGQLERRAGIADAGRWSARVSEQDLVLATVFEDLLLPAVLVDDAQQILHVYGDVRRFLGFQPGQPSLRLARAVDRDLSIAVETALNRSAKTGREVTYNHDRRTPPADEAEGAEQAERIEVRVRPVRAKAGADPFAFLVFFNAQLLGERVPSALPAGDDAVSSERIADLERELQHTKENLQATIEELETSNEELQATNEELIAANEELQSTNEELQSVNEELYTVNAEYQAKIQELTDLNDDMDNLLASTRLGVLFLGDDMTIRKFTPAVAEYVSVRDGDIDRPLADFNRRINYPELVGDAARILAGEESIRREVGTDDGRFVQVRIMPYRTRQGLGRRGVVVTIVDISELETARGDLREERDLFARVMETVASGVIVLDRQERVTFANANAERLLGVGAGELRGRHFDDPAWVLADSSGARLGDGQEAFHRVLDSAQAQHNLRQTVTRADGTCLHLAINASPVPGASGQPEGVLLVLTDSSLETDAIRRLEVQGDLLGTIPCPVALLDESGWIHEWNRGMERASGRKRAEVLHHSIDSVCRLASGSASILSDLAAADRAHEPLQGQMIVAGGEKDGARLMLQFRRLEGAHEGKGGWLLLGCEGIEG